MMRAGLTNGKPATRFKGWGSAAPSVLAINLVLSINLLVLPVSSRAAEPPPGPTPAQSAKQHYLKAEAYFRAHDFSAAMGEYQSGYEEKADPVFIFNIAQCQRLLGHPGPALQSYRRYLHDAPEGAGHDVAERQIAELEGLMGGEGAAPSTTPVPLAPAATTAAEAAPPPPSPAETREDPTVEAPPMPSGAPHAPGLDPLAAPPSSGPPSDSPAVTRRSLTAVHASSPTAPASPALGIRSEEPAARPIYRRWWFWVAAGALSIATIVAIEAASSGGKPACDADRICR